MDVYMCLYVCIWANIYIYVYVCFSSLNLETLFGVYIATPLLIWQRKVRANLIDKGGFFSPCLMFRILSIITPDAFPTNSSRILFNLNFVFIYFNPIHQTNSIHSFYLYMVYL